MNTQRIERIKKSNNIKDIVADFGISLKANRGKCPFCNDGSGAFSVSQDYYNCFKCEAKGDIVEFVKQSQNLDFMSAMKFLGARAGIPTEESITKTAGNEPKAAAIMYLNQERGLNISENWYSQESFGYGNKQSATVRFVLGETYWERIIDAHLFNRKANFGGACKGESWQPSKQRICKNDRIYITEGIFDAIALLQSQKFKVTSAMSTSNFPQKLIDKHQGKNITWCLALDNGDAGSAAAKKWTAILCALGEKVEVYYPQNKKDWNDLYRTKELTADLLNKYWWRGQILVAQSAAERMAWLIVKARVNKQFVPTNKVLSFKNCYFNCKVIEFKERNAEESTKSNLNDAIEDGQYFEAVNTIKPLVNATRISTATAALLYTQIDNIDQTYSYYFDIAMLGVKKRKKVAFDSNMITDAKAFNLALLKKVGQSTFSGESCHMRQILDAWFANRKPTIETIRHMGYSPIHKAYVFENFGYKNGHFYKTNKNDYLDMGSLSLKTTFSGWNISSPLDKKAAWFNDLYLAGGNNALTGLAFWLMSLFATQIRAKNNQGTIPFFEFTGMAHTGKSTIIEFLWKLIGREGHEGEDPEKMTFAALARYLMQASNIPVVLLEGDRDPNHHRKRFSLDSMKTMFRGQSPYGRGVKNNGIDIDNVPFLGTLVISQNAAVEGEPQILSRIVQCIATKKNFSKESLSAANRLKKLNGGQVIHFLHDALSKENQIIQEYESWFEKYKDFLFKSDKIQDARIAENHAQIMAFGKCLKLIVPELDNSRLKNWLDFMINLAENRQLACQADPALIIQFWEIYETFNERVFENNHSIIDSEQKINHSKDPDLIAINLPLFKKIAEENRQQIDVDSIKKLLINSKKHKFVCQKKIRSEILETIIHCWIFKK